ncbi:MAG: tetratricopeptide repeat protein [Betaproteobacteria bacterium]|nr:tetratricopeptide repeat protein [Betaproteobacteria bacterium]
MALSRFLVAVAAGAMLAGPPARADEIQDINLQFRNGDLPAALDHANRYLAKNPKDARARFLKGLILGDLGKTDDAIEVLKGLTGDYPELREPYNNLAVLYASQGRYEAARDALEMAIRAHPDYATAHENLGDIYAKMAAIEYDKALSLDAKNATAQTRLKLLQTMLGGQTTQPAAKPASAPAAPAGEASPKPGAP